MRVNVLIFTTSYRDGSSSNEIAHHRSQSGGMLAGSERRTARKEEQYNDKKAISRFAKKGGEPKSLNKRMYSFQNMHNLALSLDYVPKGSINESILSHSLSNPYGSVYLATFNPAIRSNGKEIGVLASESLDVFTKMLFSAIKESNCGHLVTELKKDLPENLAPYLRFLIGKETPSYTSCSFRESSI